MTHSILFDARLILEKPTGIGQYISSLLPELIKHAPDIHFHLLRRPSPWSGYKANSWESDNLTQHTSDEPHMSLRQHITIPRLAKQLNVDLLHYPHFDAPVWYQPVPTVATIYDTKYLTHKSFFPNLSTLKRAYMKMCYASTLARSSHILTISHATKIDLQKIFSPIKRPITVTHLAADDAFVAASQDQIKQLTEKYDLKRPFILSVGERRPHKNHESLIHAYAQSKAQQTHDLIIIGQPYAEYHGIEETIRQHKMETHVHLLDRVSFEDLVTFYSAADLFVLISLYEGYGLPVVEAMACGTAVISSNTTSLTEVTGKGGVQVNPLDLEEITEAIDNLLQDDQSRQEWESSGKTWAQQFSWEKAAAETLTVYRQVMETQPKSRRSL